MTDVSAVQVLLQHANPGQALMGLFDIDEGEVAAILIREEPETAARLPAEPEIYMRSGALLEDVFGTKVVVCALLAYVQGVECTYEVWLNYRNPGHRLCLERLKRQQKLLFLFYVDGPEPVRRVYLPNPFAGFATQVAAAAETMPVWSMQQFDVARGIVKMRNPEPHILWDVLTPEGEPKFPDMRAHVGLT